MEKSRNVVVDVSRFGGTPVPLYSLNWHMPGSSFVGESILSSGVAILAMSLFVNPILSSVRIRGGAS